VNTKFIGLITDNHINWKNCFEEMMPQLHAACYAIMSMAHISNINALVSIYYAYFRSVIKYGPGVDSASNRNEYQEHFLGVKAAGV
jgi:hypothetical protein